MQPSDQERRTHEGTAPLPPPQKTVKDSNDALLGVTMERGVGAMGRGDEQGGHGAGPVRDLLRNTMKCCCRIPWLRLELPHRDDVFGAKCAAVDQKDLKVDPQRMLTTKPDDCLSELCAGALGARHSRCVAFMCRCVSFMCSALLAGLCGAP